MFCHVSYRCLHVHLSFFFFFNDPAPTEIYTLSLHDALPISCSCPATTSARRATSTIRRICRSGSARAPAWALRADRKSTRLNSSHVSISYAVFCLKKKKKKILINKLLQ